MAATSGCGDLYSLPPDLTVPPMSDGPPRPGRRVRHQLPGYRNTDIHHSLYLPEDWNKQHRYPLLVEYAGNGGYLNSFGDQCSGMVADSVLGYGIGAGRRFLWLCLPFVVANRLNAITWWGDVSATVAYCKEAVESVCREFHGRFRTRVPSRLLARRDRLQLYRPS